MISIPYTVNDFLYYSQGIPDAYNRVRRICPKGTADSPCKVMAMCCCTSPLSLLAKLAPLAPRFNCLHKCCICSVSFQQGILGA